MTKCDHPDCSNQGKYYGFQQCYFVCDEHVKWGEEIEENLMKEVERCLSEMRNE